MVGAGVRPRLGAAQVDGHLAVVDALIVARLTAEPSLSLRQPAAAVRLLRRSRDCGPLTLGLVFALITFIWLALYALVVAKAGDLLRRPAIRRAIDGITGALLGSRSGCRLPPSTGDLARRHPGLGDTTSQDWSVSRGGRQPGG